MDPTLATTGPLHDSERSAAMQLVATALPGFGDATFLRDFPEQQTFAVRVDGTLSALLFWRAAQVLVHGRPTSIALLGPPAINPAHRRTDALASHQTELLSALRVSGFVLAGLQSPITQWHRRHGWGICSATIRVQTMPDEIRPVIAPEEGCFESPTSIDEVRTLHDVASRDRFGFLERSPERWADLLRLNPPYPSPTCALWRGRGGRPEGYVLFGHEPERPGSDRHNLVVHELVTLTSSAYLGLLDYLAKRREAAGLHLSLPQDDPLSSVLRDSQRVTFSLGIDRLLRVVDFERLSLAARGIDLAAAEDLVVLTDDTQAPWNSGLWRVYAGETEALQFRLVAQAKHMTLPKKEAWVRVPAMALGPLISRHLSIQAALSCGLLKASGHEALVKLEALLGHGLAPYCPDPW